MLENPELIRGEIDRRVREIQESNPTKMRKEVLLKESTRVQKGIDSLLDAYQEGLLPIEQLRARIPGLRKREATLKSELQTLAFSVVDQERINELAGSIEGFLERLRKSAESLDIKERQRVLRLVVKEILVGPDTLTIKHSIPTSSPSGTPEVPSYVLCGWRHLAVAGQYLSEQFRPRLGAGKKSTVRAGAVCRRLRRDVQDGAAGERGVQVGDETDGTARLDAASGQDPSGGLETRERGLRLSWVRTPQTEERQA